MTWGDKEMRKMHVIFELDCNDAKEKSNKSYLFRRIITILPDCFNHGIGSV